MFTVNIFDNTCAHHVTNDGYFTSTAGRRPSIIDFVYKQPVYDGVTLFTDEYIFNDCVLNVQSKYKVAWCLESPAVKPFVHNNIQQVADRFDYIFTYREDLILDNPQKYIPNNPGGSYIPDSDINLFLNEKTKRCSIVLSGKQDLEGHKLRHQIYHNSRGIDGFGWGTSNGYLQNKTDALKSYMFSIVVENTRAFHYFTEKLIDCILTGCVPIYWGAPNIDKYFNTKGFIIFNSFQELTNMKLTKHDYHERLEAIKENFTIALKYKSSDDVIASKILNLIERKI